MRSLWFAATLALCGCAGGSSTQPPPPSSPTFSFTVEDVFYIKPPVDRVVLVGTINEGTVRVGDSLVVRCQGGDVPVVLDGIDTIRGGPLQEASAGQQVGLKLAGVRKEQPARGDQVTRALNRPAP